MGGVGGIQACDSFNNQVPSELLLKLKGAISSSLHQLEELVYSGDQSVYTGSAGNWPMHWGIAPENFCRPCASTFAGGASSPW